ncbi:MAG: hypothetical protein OEQ18_00455 [Gammaproteobacteria bacterium]|nr:hypothetical protein [Gammaproteobacteria bacterium]
MFRKTLMPIVAVLGVAVPHAYAQQPQQPESASAAVSNPVDPAIWAAAPPPGAPVQNWSDPMAWMAAGKSTMPLNLAHPAGWAAFINPYTHTGVHTALMNPATYAQFMQPQFWMQFVDPNNLFAWFNPASYATFLNPATYTGWMNPAAYMHVMHPAIYMQPMNPGNYMPFINPATYLGWMNPAAYTMPGASTGGVAPNWFDPNIWGQYGQPQAQGEPQPPETETQKAQ